MGDSAAHAPLPYDCRSTRLERQPYTRTQRVGILRVSLDDLAGADWCVDDGGCPGSWDAFGRVQRTAGEQVAASDSEGRVRGEPPGEQGIRAGPGIAGIARHPAVLAHGRTHRGSDVKKVARP